MAPVTILVKVLVVVALSMMIFRTADACSCMEAHPQNTYCKSDFVIRFKVIGRFVKTHNVVYKIIIEQEYKMSDMARLYLKDGRLITPGLQSSCNINLVNRETYVAMGSVSYPLSLCSFIRPYSSLTVVQKRAITGVYKKGCNCNISHSWFPRNANSLAAPSNTCRSSGSCEMDYGVCIQRDNTCIWRKNSYYRKCKTDPTDYQRNYS